VKKYITLLLILLYTLTLIGCTQEVAQEVPDINEEDPPVEDVDIDEDDEESLDDMLNRLLEEMLGPDGDGNPIAHFVTSDAMRAFEAEHAVSEAQERYLAFGAFVLTNNRESIRVLALGESYSAAARILANSWSVTDHESAYEQLTRLASANGQSPVADDIFHTFIQNGRLEPIDEMELLFGDFDITGLENVYNSALGRAERAVDEFELFLSAVGALEEEREEVFEVFLLLHMAMRINDGLEAYLCAREMLIDVFGFTEEELLNIPTLAAWDFGRTAIIARYGLAAGYLEESEVWFYLQQAAENAAQVYGSWREYAAAHILGRAIAFGNPSRDFQHTLDFLLNHEESSFQTINFLGA